MWWNNGSLTCKPPLVRFRLPVARMSSLLGLCERSRLWGETLTTLILKPATKHSVRCIMVIMSSLYPVKASGPDEDSANATFG
jgi:hypothetical protein